MMTDKLPIGSYCPDFSLRGTDSKLYSLESFADSKLLCIVFACNHCPYVRAYESRLKELQKTYSVSDLRVVFINANDAEKYPEDSFVAMQIRHSEESFNFPYLHDTTQAIAVDFKAEFTPEVFLFDQNRKLAYYGKIDDNWNNPEKVKTQYLANAIEELLIGNSVSVPETYAIGCTIKWK